MISYQQADSPAMKTLFHSIAHQLFADAHGADITAPDQFDKTSIHVLCFDDDTAIGGARIVLDSQEGLPIEHILGKKLQRLQHQKIAEISRLCLMPEYRRMPSIVMKLFRHLSRICHENKITHCYTLMEQSLQNTLLRAGYNFKAIGPSIKWYGDRTPYCITE
jgi:N-acyl-L-homoserine lactone synthetase